MKRKLFLLPFLFILNFVACGKIQDGVVDNQFANYQVQKITAPSSFVFSEIDSVITISVQIQNYSQIKRVWISIKTEDGKQYLATNYELNDNGNKARGDLKAGDGIYSEIFPMSKKNTNGKYIIEFFAEDNLGLGLQTDYKIGEQAMTYDNKQTNYPPVISNLKLVDSINRNESFTITIKADDPNGLADLSLVFFKLYRPDGTVVLAAPGQDFFPMLDNGDAKYGDSVAGDGTYSLMNSFQTTSTTGVWVFEFQAKDGSGITSNIIKHNLTVK